MGEEADALGKNLQIVWGRYAEKPFNLP